MPEILCQGITWILIISTQFPEALVILLGTDKLEIKQSAFSHSAITTSLQSGF